MANEYNHGVEQSERAHGAWLAERDPELQWGWGTPAGKLRAERRAQLIARGAGLSAGMKALEIGCGTGNFTERFLTCGATILAVDLSPDLLERARARGLSKDRVTFLLSPFEDCAVQGPFDAVIGSSVLHHLDREKSFKRILELLKPGGWMSFAEPNMLNPQVWMMMHARCLFPHVSPDETAFYKWPLKRQLAAAGFENVSITPFDWLHPSTPESLIKLVKRTESVVECLPLAREFAGSLAMRAQKPLPCRVTSN